MVEVESSFQTAEEDCDKCELFEDCYPDDLQEIGKMMLQTGHSTKHKNEACPFDEVKRILSKPSDEYGGIDLTKEDIVKLLSIDSKEGTKLLNEKAEEVSRRNFKDTIFFRGIIEFSNKCEKNCKYCGIRKDGVVEKRYTMDLEEIIEGAKWIAQMGYGSIVLQSGEITSKKRIEFILELVKRIREETKDKMAIVLSCGEYSKEVLQKFYDAGANRYLVRIETSNKQLYEQVHPQDGNHNFEDRIQCLNDLKEIGFQVGSGIIVGLPGQTLEDIAGDLLFFKKFGINMLGLGPYIHHENTPIGEAWLQTFDTKEKARKEKKRLLELTLRANAITRVLLPDINIAATTALQGLDSRGREKALQAGANVMMPIVTPKRLRKNYLLYDGKPCIDEEREQCLKCLKKRLKSIGKKLVLDQWYDPPHYYREKGLPYPYEF